MRPFQMFHQLSIHKYIFFLRYTYTYSNRISAFRSSWIWNWNCYFNWNQIYKQLSHSMKTMFWISIERRKERRMNEKNFTCSFIILYEAQVQSLTIWQVNLCESFIFYRTVAVAVTELLKIILFFVIHSLCKKIDIKLFLFLAVDSLVLFLLLARLLYLLSIIFLPILVLSSLLSRSKQAFSIWVNFQMDLFHIIISSCFGWTFFIIFIFAIVYKYISVSMLLVSSSPLLKTQTLGVRPIQSITIYE